MSTNLSRSQCDCGHQFTLGSFRGQKIEFRKYARFAPRCGCKLVCPECKKVYFGCVNHTHDYWNECIDDFDKREISIINNKTIKNRHINKFAVRINGCATSLGANSISLSYYDTYSDEGEGKDTENPYGLFTEDTDPLTDWVE